MPAIIEHAFLLFNDGFYKECPRFWERGFKVTSNKGLGWTNFGTRLPHKEQNEAFYPV
jgi:hypothetical protein